MMIMKDAMINRKKPGFYQAFSIIEIIVAVFIFMIIIAGVVPFYLATFESNLRDGDRLKAESYLQQGLEATRSIRDNSFSNLINGNHGLSKASGYWTFSGASDTFDKFTRTVTIADAPRNATCDIVASGGTSDTKTKQVTVTITWNYTQNDPGTISSTEYLTNWRDRGGCEQSSNLVVNLSGAFLSSDDTRIVGITLENIGDSPITIDKVTPVWTNNEKIEEVKIFSDIVWKYNNTGTPTGKQSSGVELNVQNVVLPPHSGAIQLDHFFFTGDMEGITFTFYVKMIDGSVRYEHIDNLH